MDLDEFVTLVSVSASDIFPNFGHLIQMLFPETEYIYFLGNCNCYD